MGGRGPLYKLCQYAAVDHALPAGRQRGIPRFWAEQTKCAQRGWGVGPLLSSLAWGRRRSGLQVAASSCDRDRSRRWITNWTFISPGCAAVGKILASVRTKCIPSAYRTHPQLNRDLPPPSALGALPYPHPLFFPSPRTLTALPRLGYAHRSLSLASIVAIAHTSAPLIQ